MDPKPKMSGLSQAMEQEVTWPERGMNSHWFDLKVLEMHHLSCLPEGAPCTMMKMVTLLMNSMKRQW